MPGNQAPVLTLLDQQPIITKGFAAGIAEHGKQTADDDQERNNLPVHASLQKVLPIMLTTLE